MKRRWRTDPYGACCVRGLEVRLKSQRHCSMGYSTVHPTPVVTKVAKSGFFDLIDGRRERGRRYEQNIQSQALLTCTVDMGKSG